jgi:hypothetical protein
VILFPRAYSLVLSAVLALSGVTAVRAKDSASPLKIDRALRAPLANGIAADRVIVMTEPGHCHEIKTTLQGHDIVSAETNGIRLNSWWLATGVPGFTVIDGAANSWSHSIIWDNAVSGAVLPYYKNSVWTTNIIWGTHENACRKPTLRDSHIVGRSNIIWGTDSDLDNIVWGT